ncbi:MAG: HDIG domain-containing metalloprotein [candidate division WOR-3 bacterium]
MTREEAWSLVQSRVANRNLQKHMLATEACLRGLARSLGEDEEKWGLAGLVHDIDYEETKNDTSKHGHVGAEMLKAQNVEPDVIHAVLAHVSAVPAESNLDKALYAADPITGLIVAATLMHPTKKLANVDTEFVLRRYAEKRFAAGANREQIATCSTLGLTLEEFTAICLDAMKGIASELGL